MAAKLLELIRVLGPKLKDALPLILALLELFAKSPSPGAFGASASTSALTDEAAQIKNEAVAAGASAEDAEKLARLL